MSHHYLKNTIKQHSVKLTHKPSSKLKSDLFTKELYRTRFEYVRTLIDIAEMPDVEHTTLD